MTKIEIGTRHGVSVFADAVEVDGVVADLQIRIIHKNFGEPLNKHTGKKLALELQEWLIKREDPNAIILQ